MLAISKILLAKISLAGLAVKQGRGREAIPNLKRLVIEADSLGQKYLSVQCSIYLAEALIGSKDYAQARQQADTLRNISEKLGFKLPLARSHYFLGEILRLGNQPAEAAPQYQQARQILEDMSKEANSDGFLKRSDLLPIMSASTH